MILLHQEQINNLIAGAAIVGAKTAAIMMGGCKDMILKKDAYAKYGNKTVKKWHKEGLLHPKRSGTCVYFPTIELMIASQAEQVSRITPNASDEIRIAFEQMY